MSFTQQYAFVFRLKNKLKVKFKGGIKVSKKSILALFLTFIMCLSLFGCGTYEKDSDTEATSTESENQETSEQPKEASKKILRYSITSDTPTLDPQHANSVVTTTIGAHIFEGLVRAHDGEILPGMAEKWEVSDDGKTYTFHLRDAKWSDGKPVTAQNFEYGIKRLLDPATASGYAFLGYILENADKVNKGELPVDELGVKAIDEKTLEITLKNPTDYFLGCLHMMQFYAVREDLVEKHGKEFAVNADQNVYNGPFILKEWRHEDRLILEKNPNYWNKDKVNLEEVNIIVVPDENTALNMYESGELDFVDIPTLLVEQYRDKAEFYFSGADDFLKLNMDGRCPLDNKNLRLAINYGINREDYINITTSGLYSPGTRYVLPVVQGVNDKYGEEYPLDAFPVKGDMDKAKEFLGKAMEDLGIDDPSKIELEFLTTDQEVSRIQAEVIQDQLQRNLGITVDIRQVPYKQRLQMESKHEFEMVFSGWAPDYDDPMTYLELWTTDSPYNHGSYSSDKYDELVNYAKTSTDKQKRMDSLFEAEKTLLEDGGIVPLQMRRIAWLKNPKLRGVVKNYVGPREDYVFADIEE